MGRHAKDLTEREKAAIYYYVFGGCSNWQTLHAISKPGECTTSENPQTAAKMAYEWKNRPKVAEFLKDTQTLKVLQETENAKKKAEQIIKEWEEGSNKEHTESNAKRRTREIIDFSNPQERRKQYNAIINNAGDDPKTQLDALKVLEQLQKDDKQAAKDNQIQRFYTPLKCRECPLYEKAKKKVTI